MIKIDTRNLDFSVDEKLNILAAASMQHYDKDDNLCMKVENILETFSILSEKINLITEKLGLNFEYVEEVPAIPAHISLVSKKNVSKKTVKKSTKKVSKKVVKKNNKK